MARVSAGFLLLHPAGGCYCWLAPWTAVEHYCRIKEKGHKSHHYPGGMWCIFLPDARDFSRVSPLGSAVSCTSQYSTASPSYTAYLP